MQRHLRPRNQFVCSLQTFQQLGIPRNGISSFRGHAWASACAPDPLPQSLRREPVFFAGRDSAGWSLRYGTLRGAVSEALAHRVCRSSNGHGRCDTTVCVRNKASRVPILFRWGRFLHTIPERAGCLRKRGAVSVRERYLKAGGSILKYAAAGLVSHDAGLAACWNVRSRWQGEAGIASGDRKSRDSAGDWDFSATRVPRISCAFR